jgi:hypothetical protein
LFWNDINTEEDFKYLGASLACGGCSEVNVQGAEFVKGEDQGAGYSIREHNIIRGVVRVQGLFRGISG